MVSTKKTPGVEEAVKAELLHGDTGAVSRTRKSTKGKQRPTYRRRVKPPYSYAELITMAIKSSRDGMMTLRQIVDHMSSRYECFRGIYVGWKNSVRHNLSANDCFVKVLRDTQRPYGKDNYWKVQPSCPDCMMTGSVIERPLCTVDSTSSPPTTPPHLAGYDTPSPARSSPVPSSKDIDAHPAVPHFDDWSEVHGLFRPDTDLDLALYKDGLDFADSHQAFASIAVTPQCESPDRPNQLVIKTEPVSPPPYSSGVAQPFHHAGANVYQRGIPSLHATHFPIFTSTTKERTTYKSDYSRNSSCSGRPHRSGGVAGQGFRETGRQRGDGFGLGSIVASAIRGSLSLDLDESALQAIERSVRLLDQPRYTDFSYCS